MPNKPKTPAELLAEELDNPPTAIERPDAMWRCGLRAKREAVGLRQVAVVKALKISQPSFSAWESGLMGPPLRDAFRLAKFYGTTVDELWELIEEPKE